MSMDAICCEGCGVYAGDECLPGCYVGENDKLRAQIKELGEVLEEGILSEMIADPRHPDGFYFEEEDTPLKERAKVMRTVYWITLAREKELEGILDVMKARMVAMQHHVPERILDAIVKTHPFPPEPGEE
jgi:hypothetical protein